MKMIEPIRGLRIYYDERSQGHFELSPCKPQPPRCVVVELPHEIWPDEIFARKNGIDHHLTIREVLP